jgi:hypothetical protein
MLFTREPVDDPFSAPRDESPPQFASSPNGCKSVIVDPARLGDMAGRRDRA